VLLFDSSLLNLDQLFEGVDKDIILIPAGNDEDAIDVLCKHNTAKESIIDNLYILSHGTAGEIRIGKQPINKKEILRQSEKISRLNIKNINIYI
jgi:hypothetical protein